MTEKGTAYESSLIGLKKLREPFPENQIGKLAKGSKAQTQCKNEDKKKCDICGGFHHPKMIHIDFVGHAALTDRLLDADPFWYWEPISFTEKGLPAFDDTGGLWIRLFICGHSRIGYGNAEPSQYKEVGSREKEVIGDALRNAAMRFGAALELWHKGSLHIEDDSKDEKQRPVAKGEKEDLTKWTRSQLREAVAGLRTEGDFVQFQRENAEEIDKDLGKEEAARFWEWFQQERDHRDVPL